MDTPTVAKAFTELCAKGLFDEAGATFWADDVVSREPMPGEMAEVKGRKAVEAKGEWWYANNTIHEVKVEGPYVFGNEFAVRFQMDFTPKDGQRMKMDELGVYTVRDGKIIDERFFYGGAAA